MWVVLIHIHDVCVYRLLVAIVTASHAGFRRVPRTTWGCVTPCCGLLVVVNSHLDIFAPFSYGLFSFIFMMFVFIGSWWRSLRLVMLVFEGYLELHGGVLLLAVGCLLLHDHYIWSYCFLKNVSNLVGVCYSLL